jgi:guanylate kinase
MSALVRRPVIFLISAPSGAGKTTLCERLRKDFPDIHFAITATTRNPRSGERHGVSYYFLTDAEFDAKAQAGEFLETARVYGHRYGSPAHPLEDALMQGSDVLLNIDVQGAMSVREFLERLPEHHALKRDLVDIFIVPPSLELLRQRLEGRGTDARDVMDRRLRQAETELAHWREYRYVVVNDCVEDAHDVLRAIVLAERH